MSQNLTEIITEANTLFTELTSGMGIDLKFPQFTMPPEIPLPSEAGPAYDELPPISLDQLTTKQLDGTGVFDVLMQSVTEHLKAEHKANRITGADYAKVYLGSITQVLAQGVQFLLGKDRARLENVQLQEAIKLTQAQRTRALIEAQTARATLLTVQADLINAQLRARMATNEFALSKMNLITGYNGILESEARIRLTNEQVEVQRAQTWDTHLDGSPITGILGKQKDLADAQLKNQLEELDTQRAQTKDTLLDGTPISGILAIEKRAREVAIGQAEAQTVLTKEQAAAVREDVLLTRGKIALTAEQVNEAREQITHLQAQTRLVDERVNEARGQIAHLQAQTRLVDEQVEVAHAQISDTMTDGRTITGLVGIEKLIKLAQKQFTEEQVDTQRAQTKDTLQGGMPVSGLVAKEKDLKAAQTKYVLEQYESQRGQTRGTLSTGETVGGLIGVQQRLYEQQIISYKRDAESKGVKMLLDTWVARKTIDEGVPVPAAIDGAALNSAITSFRNNLNL